MPAETTWITEGRITYTRAYEDIYCNELADYGAQLEKHLHSSTALVHHVIDTTDIGAFPLHTRHYQDVFKHFETSDTGWAVIVGTHPLLKVAIDAVASVATMRVHIVQTLDDALTFLALMDESLMIDALPEYQTAAS